MTIVTVGFDKWAGVAVTGFVRWRPAEPILDATSGRVVSKSEQSRALDESGAWSEELEPTQPGEGVIFAFAVDGFPSHDYCFEIPDQPTIDLVDLLNDHQIDPVTLTKSPSGQAAWDATLVAVRAEVATIPVAATTAVQDAIAAVGPLNDTQMTTVATDSTSAFHAAIAAQIAAGGGGGPADWFSAAFVAPEASDLPVITVSPVSTIAGGTLIRETRTSDGTAADLASDPHFLYDGMLELPQITSDPTNYVEPQPLPGADSSARYQLRIHTQTDTTVLEYKLRPLATTFGFRVKINGQWVQQILDRPTGLTAGGVAYVRLAFSVARLRVITYEDAGSSTGFGGVVVPVGATLTRPTLEGLRMAVLGDSYAAGSSNPPDGATRMETWANNVARLLGASEFINFAIGSQGWVDGPNPFGTRTAAIAAFAPDVLICMGSRNDKITDLALIAPAVTTVLNQLTSIPQIYVTGPSTPGFEAQNEAVKAGTLAAGRTFIDGITGAWITADDLGSDGVHPTFAGHQKIARGLYEGIRANPDVGPVPPPAPAVLFHETFDKPDSDSSWGTPDVGNAWTKSGTITPIIENGSGGASAAVNSAFLFGLPVGGDGTGHNVYRAKLRTAGAAKLASAAFNYSGTGTVDMIRVQGDSTGSGNWTVLIQGHAPTNSLPVIPQADGDEIVLTRESHEDEGDTITVTINGAVLYTGTEPNLGAFPRLGVLFSTARLDCRWEEFEVTALS